MERSFEGSETLARVRQWAICHLEKKLFPLGSLIVFSESFVFFLLFIGFFPLGERQVSLDLPVFLCFSLSLSSSSASPASSLWSSWSSSSRFVLWLL